MYCPYFKQNNVDIKRIIGFILIGVLLMLWVWTNTPEQAEIIEQENQQTEIEENSKDKEIGDNVLRQTMFLFNLELWHQIFLDEDNFKKPILNINKFV